MIECKIATVEDMHKKWDYEINRHPGDNRWKIWKDIAIHNMQKGNRICFYGFYDGEIVAEATAIVSKLDSGLERPDLIKENGAYLEAFRVNANHQGKGYFSVLYKFMENFLKEKGFTNLVVGVEPSEVRNIQIYFHYGFTEFLFWDKSIYPPEKEGEKGEEVMVNYYLKRI